MQWFDLIIFLLSTLGLTFIVVFFRIFKWLRELTKKISPNFLGKLFNCSACFGFWSGLFVRFIQTNSLDISIILYGFISSFVCYVTYLLIKPLMDRYD